MNEIFLVELTDLDTHTKTSLNRPLTHCESQPRSLERSSREADNERLRHKKVTDLSWNPRQVSFFFFLCNCHFQHFSTFQTHIKVLRLCFRLQDQLFIHIISVLSLFQKTKLKKKNFYSSKNVCLYVCTEQKLLFYSFSLFGCYIYIMKSFRFGILWSPLQSVSYIYKL